MKKLLITSLFAIALVSCDSTKKIAATETPVASEKSIVSATTGTKLEKPAKPAAPAKPARVAKPMLVGAEKRASLEAMPYGAWFKIADSNFKTINSLASIIFYKYKVLQTNYRLCLERCELVKEHV